MEGSDANSLWGFGGALREGVRPGLGRTILLGTGRTPSLRLGAEGTLEATQGQRSKG